MLVEHIARREHASPRSFKRRHRGHGIHDGRIHAFHRSRHHIPDSRRPVPEQHHVQDLLQSVRHRRVDLLQLLRLEARPQRYARARRFDLVFPRQKHRVSAVVRDIPLRRELLEEALGGRGDDDDVAHLQVVPRLPVDVVFVVPLHDLEDVVVRLSLAVRLVQRHHDRKPDVHERIHQAVDVLRAPAVQIHRLFQVEVAHDRRALRRSRAVAGELQLQQLRQAFWLLAVAERAVLPDDPTPLFVDVVEDPGVDLVVEPVDVLP